MRLDKREPGSRDGRDHRLMGMTGGLVRASLDEIARLREHPSELAEFLGCGVWAPPNREVRPRGILRWLLRLTPMRIYQSDHDAVAPPADDGPIRPSVDLDKAWEPLHFLLTGTAFDGDEPACYLTRGGEELAEDVADRDNEFVYSSARALTPEQVASFDRHLSSLTVEELRRRFDAGSMPQRSKRRRRPDDETFDYLIEAFEELRTFVREAAATGGGAIAYLT